MRFEDFNLPPVPKFPKKLHGKIQVVSLFLCLRESLYELYNDCKEDPSYPEEDGEVWVIIEKVEDLMKYFVSEVN